MTAVCIKRHRACVYCKRVRSASLPCRKSKLDHQQRERLYEQVWGEDSVGCDNTVMVHIRHIREKIEDDPTNPKLLQTVKRLGYRLVKRDS